MTSLRETYARDICQNPGVPLEDCPRAAEHYALVDERLAGLLDDVQRYTLEWDGEIGRSMAGMELDPKGRWCLFKEAAAIVAALEEGA